MRCTFNISYKDKIFNQITYRKPRSRCFPGLEKQKRTKNLSCQLSLFFWSLLNTLGYVLPLKPATDQSTESTFSFFKDRNQFIQIFTSLKIFHPFFLPWVKAEIKLPKLLTTKQLYGLTEHFVTQCHWTVFALLKDKKLYKGLFLVYFDQNNVNN